MRTNVDSRRSSLIKARASTLKKTRSGWSQAMYLKCAIKRLHSIRQGNWRATLQNENCRIYTVIFCVTGTYFRFGLTSYCRTLQLSHEYQETSRRTPISVRGLTANRCQLTKPLLQQLHSLKLMRYVVVMLALVQKYQ
jgi:hypothetical protein